MRYTNASGYTDFNKLYKEGVEGEVLAKDFLEIHGYTDLIGIDDAMLDDDSLSKEDWDIQGFGPKKDLLSFEVKTQPNCHEYTGVNIETIQNGKESGLITTKSDWYIFVNQMLGFGFIKTSVLRDYNDSRYRTYKTRAKNPAEGYILPLNELIWIK